MLSAKRLPTLPTPAAGLAVLLLGWAVVTVGCRPNAFEVDNEPRRVVDSTAALSDGERLKVEDYLEYIATERGIDYRVVLLDDTPRDLEVEAVANYERLDVGDPTEGRGLLLLVDLGTHEARVEVGYSLEHQVTDIEASSMVTQLLAPYFASGQTGVGIEASVERLLEILHSSSDSDRDDAPAIAGSGGAGATANLLQGIDRLTPETEAKLASILVPQVRPEDCIRLEMELMSRGIYFRDAPMYDDAWRRSRRPGLPPERVRAIARDWVGPFAVEQDGDHAIAYFDGEKARRFGPHFLRRTEQGWIVDGSAAAQFIRYDYSNAWFAVDGDYPYLALIHRVYKLKRGTAKRSGPAWMLDES